MGEGYNRMLFRLILIAVMMLLPLQGGVYAASSSPPPADIRDLAEKLAPLIKESCNGSMVDASDIEALREAVLRILELHRVGCLNADQDPARRRALAAKYSRRQQTRELAALLESLVI